MPPCNFYTRDYDANVRIASQVLLGALDAGKKLESVVLGGVNYRILTQDASQMSKLAQVLQHVQHLHWDVGETFVIPREDDVEIIDGHEVHMGPNVDDAEFDQFHATFNSGHFSKFVAEAANLQTLVINIPELGSTQLRPVEFVDVVGELHFQHLRRFSLKRVQTNMEGLESFLIRHRGGLVELRMCDLYQSPEAYADTDEEELSWDDFFCSIAGHMPCLEKVFLRGGLNNLEDAVSHVFGHNLSEYVGTPFSRAMEFYILHGGSTVPSGRDYRGLPPSAHVSPTLLDWAGGAMVPEIQPIGWDISWEL